MLFGPERTHRQARTCLICSLEVTCVSADSSSALLLSLSSLKLRCIVIWSPWPLLSQGVLQRGDYSLTNSRCSKDVCQQVLGHHSFNRTDVTDCDEPNHQFQHSTHWHCHIRKYVLWCLSTSAEPNFRLDRSPLDRANRQAWQTLTTHLKSTSRDHQATQQRCSLRGQYEHLLQTVQRTPQKTEHCCLYWRCFGHLSCVCLIIDQF